MRFLNRLGSWLVVSLALAGNAPAAETCHPEAASSAFDGLVKARNARDPEAVMSFVAKDALLSYPGSPDAGYEALSAIFQKSFANPDLTGRYSADVEEVQVAGELAFVRALWTGELVQKSTGRRVRTLDKDLEVWRCQPDGSWKLYRGLSFPVESPAQPGP